MSFTPAGNYQTSVRFRVRGINRVGEVISAVRYRYMKQCASVDTFITITPCNQCPFYLITNSHSLNQQLLWAWKSNCNILYIFMHVLHSMMIWLKQNWCYRTDELLFHGVIIHLWRHDMETPSTILALLTLKSFYLKAFSRKHGCDWLMLKHQPITATLSAKSF